MTRITRFFALAGALALGALCAGAQAQDKWPSKPITYVVPFAAGGATDILGRLIASQLGPVLGTAIVVENRPGAGGNIGSDYVAKSKPDGYTLVGGTISSHSINTSLYPDMPYDPVKAFVPIALTGTLPNVLVVQAETPYKTVDDVIRAARKDPGGLTFGSAGNGTSQHLAGELFKSMAGVDMLHIPFKGSTPALTALLGKQVVMVFENISAALPLIKAGKLRAVAVTSRTRSADLPDTPTMDEAGLKGYEIVSWQAVFAPAGTPPAIVTRLSNEITRIIKQPDISAKIRGMGVEPSGDGTEALAAFQKSEVKKWGDLVKAAHIRLE
jgi:tripartite-type tricarboxylate transporter receptor subunit TctC